MFRLANCSYRKRNIQLFEMLQRWVKFESLKVVQVRPNVGLFFLMKPPDWPSRSYARDWDGVSNCTMGLFCGTLLLLWLAICEVAQKCESKFVLRNRYNYFFFRNASRNGGACAERKMSQSLITFHSPQRLGILCPPEPGRLLDYLSTSKTPKDLVYFWLNPFTVLVLDGVL